MGTLIFVLVVVAVFVGAGVHVHFHYKRHPEELPRGYRTPTGSDSWGPGL